jgi:hypothetical protein
MSSDNEVRHAFELIPAYIPQPPSSPRYLDRALRSGRRWLREIFEAEAGGLFVPSEAGARPGNFVTLPEQIVDSNGNITVP